jgi:zinc protease
VAVVGEHELQDFQLFPPREFPPNGSRTTPPFQLHRQLSTCSRRLGVVAGFLLAADGLGAQTLARRIIDSPGYLVWYTADSLPNGLRVLVVESHVAPVVSVEMFIRAGNLQQPPGRGGLAHLVEHLTGDTVSSYPQTTGFQFGATTGYSFTDYFFTAPTAAVDAGLWYTAAVLEPPQLDSAHFARGQSSVLAEANQRLSDQAYRITAACVLGAYWWGDQQCSGPRDWERSSQTITAADVAQYFNEYYRPDNVVLVFVGDITRADAMRRTSRLFAHFRRPSLPLRAFTGFNPKTARIVTRDALATSTRIDMAYPTAALTDPDFAAINVIAGLLRGPERSEFPSRLIADVEIWGLDFLGTKLPTPFVVAATLAAGVQPAEAEQALKEVMARLARKKVSADELERVKGALTRDFLDQRRNGSSRSLAYYLGFAATAHGRPDLINSWLDLVDRVTTADVSRVIEKYFLGAPRVVVTTVPADSTGGAPR